MTINTMNSAEAKLKARTLAEYEGYPSPMSLMEDVATDSVSPGICRVTSCDYTVDVEPDCTDGFCESCGDNTVISFINLWLMTEGL